MEDSSDKVPISTSTSESEVKIIGTSADPEREDSSYEEPISTQTSEVEKEISGTSVEENDGKILPYLFTSVSNHTFEVEDEIIRTLAEEIFRRLKL